MEETILNVACKNATKRGLCLTKKREGFHTQNVEWGKEKKKPWRLPNYHLPTCATGPHKIDGGGVFG